MDESSGSGVGGPEVTLTAALRYVGQRDVWLALLLVQLRPHATHGAQTLDVLRERLTAGFVEQGWESPQLFLNGGHLATAGKVAIFGRLDKGPELELYTADGELLFGGEVSAAPVGWWDIAERAGTVGVLVSSDPRLDTEAYGQILEKLSADGAVLAAAGLLLGPLPRR